MSKPEDIPQDIWDIAVKLDEETVALAPDAKLQFARAILAAKAEEREACAQLIEHYDLWFSFEPTISTGGMGAMAPHATPVVAAAIRQRGC